VQAVVTRGLAILVLLSTAGCATSDKKTKTPSVPFLTAKGDTATLISELKPGKYEASSLAVGQEKDLAQHRAEGLGFVRSAPVEQFLGSVRARLLDASRVTGVPGRVVILANPAFVAYSTADGNVFVSMGWLEYLENADEVAAILAHELSHVLLAHHSADVVSTMQHKSQAIQEIVVSTKAAMSSSKTVSRGDTHGLSNAQLLVDLTDKLALPAWNRRQEREADLLGVDLLVRAGYSPGAMVSLLEKLQAWEKRNTESDQAFWGRLSQAAQRNLGEAANVAYKGLVDAVSVSHPKTDERIEDTAQYLDRNYGERNLPGPSIGAWKAVATRADVAEMMRNYDLAFSARKMLAQGKAQAAYSYAVVAATGSTATDAYPNWILAHSAAALGRQREAMDALERALKSPEPAPQIYEDVIVGYEKAGNLTTALSWTDKASATFGGAPRWTPVKIRLLRKTGRTAEANTLMLSCSVNTPDWRRPCQEANQTPAGQARR
jgi:Zn-dependent protease with chaperone function